MYRHIQEQMEVYTCKFDIEINGKKSSQTLQAPRLVLENQFVALYRDAIATKTPMKFKMSRMVPIYDDIDKKWIEIENSVTFENNAYIWEKEEDSEKEGSQNENNKESK